MNSSFMKLHNQKGNMAKKVIKNVINANSAKQINSMFHKNLYREQYLLSGG